MCSYSKVPHDPEIVTRRECACQWQFGDVNAEDRPLDDKSKDARVWPNYVVKVRNTGLIDVRYIWRFIYVQGNDM